MKIIQIDKVILLIDKLLNFYNLLKLINVLASYENNSCWYKTCLCSGYDVLFYCVIFNQAKNMCLLKTNSLTWEHPDTSDFSNIYDIIMNSQATVQEQTRVSTPRYCNPASAHHPATGLLSFGKLICLCLSVCVSVSLSSTWDNEIMMYLSLGSWFMSVNTVFSPYNRNSTFWWQSGVPFCSASRFLYLTSRRGCVLAGFPQLDTN